ncbi:MAG: O-antigen ligase family protein [Bacteroidota bacterium]
MESFWVLLLPLLVLILLFYLFSLDKVLWFIIITTPLSLNIKLKDYGLAVSLPGEPLMIGILILFLLKLLYDVRIDKKILYHPITLTVIANLSWITITSITSTMPWISFKFLLSRLWFIVCFYYFGILLFKNLKNINRFLWAYIMPFTIIIFYTLIMHSQYGFTVDTANWIMSPFYNDHTIYGAILAMYIPVIAYFIYNTQYTFAQKGISFVFLLIFIVALVLSFTRAAWISLAIAFTLGAVMYFRINLKIIGLVGIIGLALFFVAKDRIFMKLEKNRQDSSSNLTEHVQSISNISSDASNLERINRWSAALRMFEKHPAIGFGPGTYAFKYAPFQFSYEKTIISTNAGNKGNAHSEYIGPLAESGVLGLLTFVAIVVAVFYTGISLYYQMEKGTTRALVLSLILGLTTYFVHGFLNNFLDTDKASVPVWGFAAALVAIQLYHHRKTTSDETQSASPNKV